MGCSPWGREELDTTEQLHFHFHTLEKEMATHSSVLAWRIPGTAESLVGCCLWGRTESETTEAMQQQQQHVTATVAHLKTWDNLCLKCLVAIAL